MLADISFDFNPVAAYSNTFIRAVINSNNITCLFTHVVLALEQSQKNMYIKSTWSKSIQSPYTTIDKSITPCYKRENKPQHRTADVWREENGIAHGVLKFT